MEVESVEKRNILLIWKYVPETKGKTLEEIEMSWKNINKEQQKGNK